MTPACASPHSYALRAALHLALAALGLMIALLARAEDNKQPDCNATDAGKLQGCDTGGQHADAATFKALDWWSLDTVPESLIDRECIICGGRYIDPLAEDAVPTDRPRDINADADSSWLKGSEVILIGNANATQGARDMRADKLVVDREEESAILSGNVILREPGIKVRGDSAEIQSRTGEATVFNGEFVLHREHMRGTSDILERDEDGLIHVHNGSFTYCPPGEDDWVVYSKDMVIDLEEGLATARSARIEAAGTPVFYTPWLRIPLDDRRRTGLLWPSWGNDSNGGLDVSVPIYLNLAPNYDATYAPRYIEERGLDHQLQLRYTNPLVGDWFAGGAYLHDDDKYKDRVPDASSDRWLGVLRQSGLFQQRWRSRINYSKASDVDYMQDLETANIDDLRRTNLLQLGAIDYLGDNWLTNAKVQSFQSLADDISNQYEILPQITTRYRGSGQPFSLQPIAMTQYSNFGADRDVVTGERLYGEAGMSYPMAWPFGFLTPELKYRQVAYDLSDATTFPDNTPSAGSAVANLDGGLFFERNMRFAGKSLLQTLEPRVYYLYSERADQTDQPVFDSAELTFGYSQLFRDTRFSGHDRLDDANQISLGVTSRLIDDHSGRALLSASVGQIYYFEDRKVRLNRVAEPLDEKSSEIAGNLTITPTRDLVMRSSLVWDPNEDQVDSGFALASYKPDNGSVFNLGYTFRRPTGTGIFAQTKTDEASASSFLPLDNNWSIFGAIRYSLENSIGIEDMIGVEYDSCCWTVRLLQLRYYNNVSTFTNFNDPDLEREHTIQFQFVLKGMGGFGNRVTKVMDDMIRGYEERDY
ncbi:LPS-assembly protein LptD [Candidatus Marimicrobium litorale]|uniref:LPS-assembly protein LptD n=1 Tax=Candidatus Marimicrobium litorale TaxID=2518991 RepID=A0ABT3TBK3_9GAMM|nr:LPS-assembly protein LptD [Candidatus Marimicrobium litorale]MCX2979201.1 LPS-assembly protein LptD [Candidatus Marimicrobium litorale]